jgi:hypothetical protein
MTLGFVATARYHGPMNPFAFDARAWNIVAGLCLASGCGGRVIGSDGSSDGSGTEASESAESNTTPSEEWDEPECVNDDECSSHGYGYVCDEGMCLYTGGYQDGHFEHDDESYWYPECYSDSDCDTLEICLSDYCSLQFSPLACRGPQPVPSLEIPVAALAMHFVDVDSDGAEELVVATASELQVYEGGSDIPLVSPRGLDSDSIDAMAGGPFDATPGDDVMLLIDDELRLHASDGVGNFAAPSVSASTWPDSVGLREGEFDGVAPADLLIWASSGAGVELGSGDAFPLSAEIIGAATARSLAEPPGGFVLQHNTTLDFYDVGGVAIGSDAMRGGSPYALTSASQLGYVFDLSSSVVGPGMWTIIEQWDAGTGPGSYWGLPGRVTAMAGGDFDGDDRGDIAVIVDGAVQIQFTVITNVTCLSSYPLEGIAEDLAIGDHDGDGDDELAVRFEAGTIAVFDGG